MGIPKVVAAENTLRTMARTGVWKKKGSTFEKVVAIEKKSTGKSPRFYAPEDVKAPLAKKATNKPTKLRASITPGTVLILLAGHFKGAKKEKKSGDSMFKEEAGKKELSADYLANQKAMDTALTPIIGKTKDLEAYLKAHFSLKDGDRPHLMKF